MAPVGAGRGRRCPWMLGTRRGCGSARAAELSRAMVPVRWLGSSEQPVPRESLLHRGAISMLKKKKEIKKEQVW